MMKVVVNKKDAEVLAYAYSKYDNLLTVINMWPDEKEYVIYGKSSYEVMIDLENAQ